MHNFVFHNPVKVIFGRDTLQSAGPEAAALGSRALLIYGQGSILENHVYEKIRNSLDQAQITVTEFSGVTSNPHLSAVHDCIKVAREDQCDVIIGVGGGSVLDTAKAVSAGFHVSHDVWKFFIGKKSPRQTLPLICIPTIAGSGSEINSGMVLTHDKKNLKLGFAHRNLYPNVCIANPEATFTVPVDHTAFGAVDILIHCLEGYFTSTVDNIPFQRGFVETVCKTVIETCPRVLKSPCSYDDRATLLWSAAMAMNGITTAGVGKIAYPLHLIEHGVTSVSGISHGAGLSALLIGWLKMHINQLKERLARLGSNLFSLSSTNVEDMAFETVSLLDDFLKQINCPRSLSSISISENDFDDIIDHSLIQAKIWRMKDHNSDKISRILESCLTESRIS